MPTHGFHAPNPQTTSSESKGHTMIGARSVQQLSYGMGLLVFEEQNTLGMRAQKTILSPHNSENI